MCRVLDHIEDETVIKEVRKATSELCEAFPLYPELRRWKSARQ